MSPCVTTDDCHCFPVTVFIHHVSSATAVEPVVYFMAIIDVLTLYGAKKKAAHAAKTMKHGVSECVCVCTRRCVCVCMCVCVTTVYVCAHADVFAC